MGTIPPISDELRWGEPAFDILRGIAVYTGSGLIAALAKTISKFPAAHLDNAFNHNQVACKMWARDALFATLGGHHDRITVLGAWYGILPAMLFEDSRFDIGEAVSVDIDPAVAAVAMTLNRKQAQQGRFRAVTADMYDFDYRNPPPGLVVNTSCEHIADLRGWLDRLAPGTPVLLQSNDYFAEPTHINCMENLEQFAAVTKLSRTDFAGSLPLKKYTRFMLIGRS
ncbi:MAG: class I SAM-dependent methyltransferase [Parvibaculaceae bacterium]